MTEKKKSTSDVFQKGGWISLEELRGQLPQPYPFSGSSHMSTEGKKKVNRHCVPERGMEKSRRTARPITLTLPIFWFFLYEYE